MRRCLVLPVRAESLADQFFPLGNLLSREHTQDSRHRSVHALLHVGIFPGPADEEARHNKQALMKVFEPLGVSNDRLDEVSNYYRYRPGQGRLWTNSPAQAYAEIDDGLIKRIVVTEPRAGYISPPTATIDGFDDPRLAVMLKFGKSLKENGAVDAIKLVSSKR